MIIESRALNISTPYIKNLEDVSDRLLLDYLNDVRSESLTISISDEKLMKRLTGLDSKLMVTDTGVGYILYYDSRVIHNISMFAIPNGQFGMSNIRAEVGISGQCNIGHQYVRSLGGKPSGQIAYSDLKGKSFTSKIRFTCNSWATKDNNGTCRAIFRGPSGTILDLYGGGYYAHWVCPTFGSKEHTISGAVASALRDVTSVELVRFIDTSSDGNASMKIEFLINGTYTQVFWLSSGYRTGKGWQSNTWNMRHP